MDILAQDASPVKGHLEDRPILVCTLQRGTYLLDLNKDEFDADDYIPLDGRPGYGPERSPADVHGLEARY